MFSPIKTLSQIYLRKRPFILNHKINIACDCKCRFCDSWKIKESAEDLMGTGQVKDLLDRAARAGMLSYSAWGGEPLLRDDCAEILAHARERGFFTTLSTNASLLAQRAAEIEPSTSLYLVSLDGVGNTHDKVRGFPGLFDKVVEGLEKVKQLGGRVRLYYNVNLDTVVDLEAAAGLARNMGISIFYFPVVRFPGYNDRIVPEREAEQDAFRRVLSLKQSGYPVVNLTSYLKVIIDARSVPCRFPRYHIYVDYDGTIYTCDLGPNKKLAVWGNAREQNLEELFGSKAFREKTTQLESCNACRLSCGEIGSGSPLTQFPVRAMTRIRHEWIMQ